MPLVLPCLLSLVNQIIPASLKLQEDSSSCESDASSVSSKRSQEELKQMAPNDEKQLQQDLSTVSLPDGFAERVLELEMNIQSDSTDIVSIQSLVDLYSVSYLYIIFLQLAVEHYNTLGTPDASRKHRLYVERMQNLLLRPDIILAMQQVSLTQYQRKFEEGAEQVKERMEQDVEVFTKIHQNHVQLKIQQTLEAIKEKNETGSSDSSQSPINAQIISEQ